MFEKYTDRARRVIVLAQEEARMLNHNYIGTEHILLGLIHESEGVAAKALESLGISLERVRQQVEEIIGQGISAPSGHIPFTPRAKKVVELSLREALQLGHNYIGTEHILLALIREGEGVAAQVLLTLGTDLNRVRQQVIQLLHSYQGKGPAVNVPATALSPVPYTEEAADVLAAADAEARMFGHDVTGCEHLLLSIAKTEYGAAAEALRSLGAFWQAVYRMVEAAPISRGKHTGQRTSTLRFVLDNLGPAEAASWQADRLSVDHLLLCLLQLPSFSGTTLSRLDVNPAELRTRVETTLRGQEPQESEPVPGYSRFDDPARQSLKRAAAEAHQVTGYTTIGTPHMLLGLIGQSDGHASKILGSFGISLESARDFIDGRIDGNPHIERSEPALSPEAVEVLGAAVREADAFGHAQIGTEHILLGLLPALDTAAILSALGADLDEIRERVQTVLRPMQELRAPRDESGLFARFTDSARRAVHNSGMRSEALGHGPVLGENLILTFLREYPASQPYMIAQDPLISHCYATVMLILLGLDQQTLGAALMDAMRSGESPARDHIPLEIQTEGVCKASVRESLQLGHNFISTGHLLCAIVRDEQNSAGQILRDRGVTVDECRAILLRMLGHSPQRAQAPSSRPRLSPIEEWAAVQTATLGGTISGADTSGCATGLAALSDGGLIVPFGLLVDLIGMLGGSEPHDRTLRPLVRSEGVRLLRDLKWPLTARVGLAALLLGELPPDPALRPPASSASDLRAALMNTLRKGGNRPTRPQPSPVPAIVAAAERVNAQTVTMLTILGPETVAADPVLPLRVRDRIATFPLLTSRQNTVLSTVATGMHSDALARTGSTAGGPGFNGVSRKGKITNLLPTQLALPEDILTHRYAGQELIYRLHETDVVAPPTPVTVVLDTTPPTFGRIETILRIVAHAITTTMWAEHVSPTLITLDRPHHPRLLDNPTDLLAIWSARTLAAPELSAALASADGTGNETTIVLTHHHLARDHPILPGPRLRLLTAHAPGDEPADRPRHRHHIHLPVDPAPGQVAHAVQRLLAPAEPGLV
ncbi:hypothetical protein J5X84_15600 [Streptosporangiaceae bacterium NEAU-GS5]|nr:hypothetical protein [Streptosporangiaceae bacterium NEAU-GS5]